MNKKKDWGGVTGGHTVGQKALKVFFSIVDVRVAYIPLVFIIPFYMLFSQKGYQAIYSYFRRQHNYSAFKSFYKTYVNHFLFGQMLLDRFAVYAGQEHKFKIDNPDNPIFLAMVDDPIACILATSHIGNPELCGYLLSQNTKRINGLVYGGEAREVQKNRSQIFTENNVRLISVSEDLSHIFLINEAIANGEIINMPCDRLFGSDKHVECDFLNGKVDFPMGAFVLAIQYQIPVLALFVLKTAALSYRIHVVPVPPPDQALPKRAQISEMTRSYASVLEDIVKKYPEQWFNFYKFWKK